MGVVATIVEVDATRQDPVGPSMSVDFNPQSLRLTHTATGPAATQGTGTSAVETTAVPRQVTGYTTSLSMELLFDTSRDGSDVRAKTLVLVALARPLANGSSAGRTLRFSWGSFLFTGYIDSLGETIDLFSPDGVPLRATVTLGLKGLADRDSRPGSAAGLGLGASAGFSAGLSAGVGTTPLTVTASGDTVQSLAARAGVSWKAVAEANGIDNPRLLPPGTVLDLRVSAT